MLKEMTKETFAPKLRALRQRLGLGQVELAKKLRVEGATVSRWEAGVMLPKGSHLDAIIRFFGKDYDFFCAEELSPALAELEQDLLFALRAYVTGLLKESRSRGSVR